ncbi:hypothetical protein KP509_01G125000 [Ceratopteris richardii]|nr:hypothetical protein KP509_01G125000 [Ceratopteris richardii]
MGSRRARGYQKKNAVKKVLSKRSTPVDVESLGMEGGKVVSEQEFESENDTQHQGSGDQISSNTREHYRVASNTEEQHEATSSTEEKAPAHDISVDDEIKLVKDDPSVLSSTVVDFLSTGSAADQNFVKTMEDLMSKVKDAEKNILSLNQARMQNLEQLEQTLRENEALKEQVNVLKLRLEEADIRLKTADQEKSKIKLLEQEVEMLKEKEEINALSNDDDGDHISLSEHMKAMESESVKLAAVDVELKRFKIENETLHKEIKFLQNELANASKEVKFLEQLKQERNSLQKKLAESQGKVAEANSMALELAKLKLEKQIERENPKRIETSGPSLNNTEEYSNKVSKDSINDLESLVLKLESDNEILKKVQAENEELRTQIQLLEQSLVDSDALIRSQLESYQSEVETLYSSLENLKAEKVAHSEESRVVHVPWELWSHILTFIDKLLLEKKLSLSESAALREMAWRQELKIRDVFVTQKGQPDEDIVSGLLELLKAKKRPGMHIVHIAAEMAPVAKVGGLGDVVTGLGRAFQKEGHLVEIVLPKYDCMDYSRINNLEAVSVGLDSYFDGCTFKNKIWTGIVEGLPVYFIEPEHPSRFFWRRKIYGEGDDFKRFTYFSRAALQLVVQAGKRPDIIHCHDWHTAAVAPLYWDVYVPQGLDSARIAFTCHNFEYQGAEDPVALASCGLDPERMHQPDRMQDNFIQNRINLLKGGIVFSNIVTTVSPTYAQEVRNIEGGKGLHLTLTAQAHKFFGILNGIDTEVWNPASDLLISHQYSAEDIDGKAANKEALRSALRLSGTVLDSDRPIVGCITRLVPQKGVHLIRHAIFRTLEQGGQFILLGSSPIDQIQREFEALSQQFNEHPHIRLILKYDEALSHSIYAGADIFIVPSIFEPCGLTQMIAMRYGAIPVARKTGGLNDSVFDVDDETIPQQIRNGFTFAGMHEKDLESALDRAMNYFMHRKEWWQELVKKAMMMDFSWNNSANQYAELYARAIARARTRF